MSLLGACSASGTSAPRFETPLDPGRAFASLTDEEALAFCHEAEHFVEVVYTEEMTIRSGCLGDAVPLAVSSGLPACEAQLASCIAATPPLGPVDLACATRTVASYPDCTATIGQITACADAASRSVVDLLWPLDCAQCLALLDQPDPGRVFEEAYFALEDGPCGPVMLACPTFYEGLRLAAIQTRAFAP